jgi:ubiquinone/menaquinone biosynthesis C-methylase UbiE
MHSDYSVENLSELVKEGPPPKPETIPEFSEEMSKKYAAIYANSERAGDAQTALEIVSKLPEFPSFQKMLDLGGGPGLIGMAIVASHPSMKGVIFDLPPVVNVAKALIKEYGMEDRMEVLGGDFNRDPIGEGYDLVLACSCLEAAKDIDSIVKKVYDALNTGGVFASIFNSGLTQERTKPEPLVLSSLSMALMGHELLFDQGSVADSMLRVGFKSVHSRTLNTPWGSTELNIARK